MFSKKLQFAFVVFIIDRVLKYYFVQKDYSIVNRGVSFSLLNESDYNAFLSAILILLILCFIVYIKGRKQDLFKKYYFALVAINIGAVSNLIDRITWGGVVDYIDLIILKNNLSDLLIFVGVVSIILYAAHPQFQNTPKDKS